MAMIAVDDEKCLKSNAIRIVQQKKLKVKQKKVNFYRDRDAKLITHTLRETKANMNPKQSIVSSLICERFEIYVHEIFIF